MSTVAAEPLPPFVGPDALPSIDSELATQLLASASAMIRTYCRWHIYPSLTEQLVIDGAGTVVQSLPTLRLTDLVEVRIGDTVEVDVEWSAKGDMRLDCRGFWPYRYRAIQVTMTHGYDTPPAGVAAVATSMAQRAATNPEGIRSETIGSYSIGYAINADGSSPTGLAFTPAEANWVLAPYKIPLRP